MSVGSAVAAGRRAAEAMMLDTCRITTPGARGPINPVTLQYPPVDPVVIYSGKCRIPRRENPGGASSAEAGEASWLVGEFPFALPYEDTEAVAVGMTVTYLTAALDDSLVGRVFTVSSPARQSNATARRFRMVEVVG